MAPIEFAFASQQGEEKMMIGSQTFSHSSRESTAFRLSAMALILVACFGTRANAVPSNGGGPPIGGGGGVIVNPNPPGGGPCPPPPLPAGVFLPSHARGMIRETCNGVLRPVINKPVEVILLVKQQPFTCDPNNILPPFTFQKSVATGTIDGNGSFDVEFIANDAGIVPDCLLLELKVRIIVYDEPGGLPIWQTAFYGQNASQEFFVNEDVTIACLTEGTRIRVVTPDGTPAVHAEIFINGRLHPELTNANGFVTINPPLAPRSKLVARARVFESASERSAHFQGSDKNWKYRAYITSIPLEFDANGDNVSFSITRVVEPNDVYELRLRRDAAYIGLHLVASIEWDATTNELNDFVTKMGEASKFLFNATDGQMLIERVDVLDNFRKWDEADFRVYADASLRANVDWPGGGFWNSHDAHFWRSNWMHMSRKNGSSTYIHEFGHYGLRLGDEYEDGESTHCAAGAGGSDPEFSSGKDKGSCIMFSQFEYKKICSSHPDNPHLTGTNQGDEDCWSAIKRHFTEEAPGPNGVPRWRLHTPVDRNAIIGTIPGIPVADWEALVEIDDTNLDDLCEPATFQWKNNKGFADHAKVYSRKGTGRMILQGTTDATGMIPALSGKVVGLHVGDSIIAVGTKYSPRYQQFTATKLFTEEDCTNTSIVLIQAPGAPPPPPPENQLVDVKELPFELAVQVEPGTAIGEAIIRVRAEAELAEAPEVLLTLENEADRRKMVMSLDAPTGDWVGTLNSLPEQLNMVVEASAINQNGEKAEYVTSSTMAGVAHDEDAEVVTSDGVVKMKIPAGALAEPTAIFVGGSVAPLPHDFAGRIIAGPIAAISGGGNLAKPAAIRFMLPFDNREELELNIDPSLLIVVAFDESTGLWNEIESRFIEGELSVGAEIGQFGAFVLLERGSADVVDESRTDVNGDESKHGEVETNANEDIGSDESDEADVSPAAPTSLGGGACGGGIAPASPLMLALLCTRRVGRRSRGARKGD